MVSENQANKIFIFANGNVAVFDKDGQQMPELQGSWIDFGYLRKLAQVIARDNPRVEKTNIPGVVRGSLSQYEKYYTDVQDDIKDLIVLCKKCGHEKDDHETIDSTKKLKEWEVCWGEVVTSESGITRCNCDGFEELK
jgi:hypothetical protein